jgi:hypothetical protein
MWTCFRGMLLDTFAPLVYWSYNTGWVPEAHWERSSTGAAFPACPCSRTICRWNHWNSQGIEGAVWDPSQVALHWWSFSCSCTTLLPIHQRPLLARQGHWFNWWGWISGPSAPCSGENCNGKTFLGLHDHKWYCELLYVKASWKD